MFDLGFSEMMVIAVVALVVLGPERLPKVAKTLGHLAGRMQRYVADVKADIGREMELEELRKFRQTVEETATSVRSSFTSIETGARATTDELAALATGGAEPVSGVGGDATGSGSMPAGAHVDANAIHGAASLPDGAVTGSSADAGSDGATDWIAPTTAGAMRSRAQPAIYVAPTSLAMATTAERATGQRRELDLPAPGDEISPWSAAREA